MEPGEVLTAITRCPVVARCRSDERHPCYTVVTSQPAERGTFQVPEPWTGHLDTAPILFVSSNPSIDPAELYPTPEWTNAERIDFFRERFDRRRPPWIDHRMRARRVDPTGQPSRGTAFWLATRARAAELVVGRPPAPGVDYALTEVVHCKSTNQLGAAEATPLCVTMWLRLVMRLAAARVVVLMGRQAQKAFLDEYEGLAPVAFSGPQELEGRRRIVLQLPHPNARVRRANCAPLTESQLDTTRVHLRGA